MGKRKGKKQRKKPSPKQEPHSQPTLPLASRGARIAPRVSQWIVVVVGLLAAALSLYPWLSVEERNFLDPSNPYSQLFDLVNNGYIPVTNLDVSCKFGTTINGQHIHNVKFEDAGRSVHNFAEYVAHNGRTTIPCFNMINSTGAPLSMSEGSTLNVTISYAFFYANLRYLRRSQTFRFKSLAAKDGTQHWQYL